MTFTFYKRPAVDISKLGIETTGSNDFELEDSSFDPVTRQMTDSGSIEIFFSFNDASRSPESLNDDEWNYLLESALSYAAFIEEPRYSQMVYDSGSERPEVRSVKPAPYGEGEFVATIGLRLTKKR